MKKFFLIAAAVLGFGLCFSSCNKETNTVKSGQTVELGYDGTKLVTDTSSVLAKLSAVTDLASFKTEIDNVLQSTLIQASNGNYNRQTFIDNAHSVYASYNNRYISGPFYLLENNQIIDTYTFVFADR